MGNSVWTEEMQVSHKVKPRGKNGKTKHANDFPWEMVLAFLTLSVPSDFSVQGDLFLFPPHKINQWTFGQNLDAVKISGKQHRMKSSN